MTNDELNPKPECRSQEPEEFATPVENSGLGFLSSFGFRHLSFASGHLQACLSGGLGVLMLSLKLNQT